MTLLVFYMLINFENKKIYCLSLEIKREYSIKKQEKCKLTFSCEQKSWHYADSQIRNIADAWNSLL